MKIFFLLPKPVVCAKGIFPVTPLAPLTLHFARAQTHSLLPHTIEGQNLCKTQIKKLIVSMGVRSGKKNVW